MLETKYHVNRIKEDRNKLRLEYIVQNEIKNVKVKGNCGTILDWIQRIWSLCVKCNIAKGGAKWLVFYKICKLGLNWALLILQLKFYTFAPACLNFWAGHKFPSLL